ADHRDLHSFPTRRSSDLAAAKALAGLLRDREVGVRRAAAEALLGIMQELSQSEKRGPASDFGVTEKKGKGEPDPRALRGDILKRSEEHTSELQSRSDLVC